VRQLRFEPLGLLFTDHMHGRLAARTAACNDAPLRAYPSMPRTLGGCQSPGDLV
jgi:hypothetical protein